MLATVCVVAVAALASASAASAACRSPLSKHRDPANPLALPASPGANPLNGAFPRLHREGPGYGLAAQAIAAELRGRASGFYSMSWASFDQLVARQRMSGARARRVRLLMKIATEPETFKLTVYNRGGGPGAIYQSVENYVCRVARGEIAVLTTYFVKHQSDCHTNYMTPSDMAVFRRRVNETARALGNYPFVMFSEFDAVDTAGCLPPAGWRERLAALKYEINTFSKLPHGVIYAEGGASDATRPAYAAKMLKAEGIRKIRGFFVGDTHKAWTIDEIRFSEKVSRLVGNKPYVVSTQSNGQGPKLNPHPVTQGIEQLCNPPGRGLGPRPTSDTGFRRADAFAWVTTPGRSGGRCHPGDPASGAFGVQLALNLAARANEKLGPGYPSRPY